MPTLASHLDAHGHVARRRDLLAAGFSDDDVRRALARHQIFRVRHGWYARPAMSDVAVRALRVGGRLTGLASLRARGLFVPQARVVDLAVPRGACRLRRPSDRRDRLRAGDGIRLNWIDPPRRARPSSDWLASVEEALAVVLRRELRETAIACCDAAVQSLGMTAAELDAIFARAPARVRGWRRLVDGRAEAWGETAVRLRLADAGIAFEPQVALAGVGRLDGRVSPGVFVEVDGAQHDELWRGDSPSSFEHDHRRDLAVATRGGRVIRITYAQIENDWALCLAAIEAAIAGDVGARRSARQRPAKTRRIPNVKEKPR